MIYRCDNCDKYVDLETDLNHTFSHQCLEQKEDKEKAMKRSAINSFTTEELLEEVELRQNERVAKNISDSIKEFNDFLTSYQFIGGEKK